MGRLYQPGRPGSRLRRTLAVTKIRSPTGLRIFFIKLIFYGSAPSGVSVDGGTGVSVIVVGGTGVSVIVVGGTGVSVIVGGTGVSVSSGLCVSVNVGRGWGVLVLVGVRVGVREGTRVTIFVGVLVGVESEDPSRVRVGLGGVNVMKGLPVAVADGSPVGVSVMRSAREEVGVVMNSAISTAVSATAVLMGLENAESTMSSAWISMADAFVVPGSASAAAETMQIRLKPSIPAARTVSGAEYSRIFTLVCLLQRQIKRGGAAVPGMMSRKGA